MKTKKCLLLGVFLLLGATIVKSQVAINSTGNAPSSSAALDVDFTNKGILIPRVSLTQTTSPSPISSPAPSLLVYNTATQNDVTPGYYYWDGNNNKWIKIFDSNLRPWLLNGNSGTNPTNDFLGTTDAQHLIIRTNNQERMRVLSSGNVLINGNSLIYATDVFEVHGNSSYPDAVNGYTYQINGFGVTGMNNALTNTGTGAGVYGYSLQTSSAGVRGEGGTATRGVLGMANNSTYAGVQGQNQNLDGDGVVGINAAGSGTGNGTGVFGQCSQSGGAAAGVYGLNDNSEGSAIIGYNSANAGTGNGKGVVGYTNQSGTGAAGVYSINANANGTALIAYNSATSGAGSGDAIIAITSQQDGFAINSINNHSQGTGVVGGGNNVSYLSYLTGGSGGAFTGTIIGVYGKNTNNVNNSGGGYFAHADGSTYAYVAAKDGGGTARKIVGTGTVSTIVTDTKGNKVIMSCPEAPEILFMDFGHAQLKDGKAYIKIDPILSKNILVDEQHPLKVFIQLEGECNGVYVTNKSKDGFEVVELNNGKSNVPFTWQIVAQRADEYDENGNLISKNVNRFPPAMLPMPTTSKPTQKIEINPEEFKQNIKKNEIIPPLERK